MTKTARYGNLRKQPGKAASWNELKGDVSSNVTESNTEGFKKSGSQGSVKQGTSRKDKARAKDERRRRRKRAREAQIICYHCRESGHLVVDCPKMQEDSETGVGICFKCGSTEHSAFQCRVKTKEGAEFPYAKCFICGETGHISKQCPDNPRGLYPYGVGNMVLTTFSSASASADAEVEVKQDCVPPAEKKKAQKLVKF
ncbi:PREDICTED: zinc finger CCHC domain-containing protein 9-like isoform X2 [Priapulus caudatus]|uniref:Zinc finger CCHC domain-containing protein 9-like isoform X2 n=1 Tax=Priapulus caudatus TaxID=37621 RepID=A0ABM1E9Z6_PRICU|nr:PREDICTED: zinc finger CCHC domain-containing protein 9-like isoform X2 [Priapulus caudatus]